MDDVGWINRNFVTMVGRKGRAPPNAMGAIRRLMRATSQTETSSDPALSEPVSERATVSVDAEQTPFVTVHDDAQTRVAGDTYVF